MSIVKIDKSTSVDLIPSYETLGAAGADLKAAESGVIESGNFKMIRTGVKMEIPIGYEVQIRPRSGLAAKYGVTLLNTPGTIDSDYRGEICVIMINHSKSDFKYNYGDRIAQMILSKFEKAEFIQSNLSETKRGSGGFGHTGV